MKKYVVIVTILFFLVIGINVKACELDYAEYKELGIKQGYIVGDYIFELDEGYSPSLEDLAIAARTIKEDEEESIYNILIIETGDYKYYRQTEVFGKTETTNIKNFPEIDVRYVYRNNIKKASEEEYDIVNCENNEIKVNYIFQETEGNEEYYTKAKRYASVSGTEEIEEVKYCITEESECVPDRKIEGTGKYVEAEIEYETRENKQKICIQARDKTGDYSNVECESEGIKVDKEAPVVEKEKENIQEGRSIEPEEYFTVRYSVSGGITNFYYYDEGKKSILSNLSELKSGEEDVEVVSKGGNGLVTRKTFAVEVEGNKVVYDYKTNGGKSETNKETEEVEYSLGEEIDLSKVGVKEGYEFVGWNEDASAHVGAENIKAREGIVLYAIYKKENKAEFKIQNEEAATTLSTEEKCTVYNNEESCQIEIPEINAKARYKVYGWNEDKNAHVGKYLGSETIEITENKKYYSITANKTKLSGTFYTIKENEIKRELRNCEIFNNETTCEINGNVESEDYEGRKLIGYTKDKENIQKEENFEISKGEEYYAYYEDDYEINYISGLEELKEEKDITHVYYIVGLDSINEKIEEKEIKEGKVEDGYEFIGWSEEVGKREVKYEEHEKVKLATDKELYGVYKKEIKIKYASEAGTNNLPAEEIKETKITSKETGVASVEYKVNEGKEIELRNKKLKSFEIDGEEIEPGETITLTKNTTIGVNWVVDGNYIIFDYKTNGGENSDISRKLVLREDEAVKVSEIKAYKKGWEFIGWSDIKGSNLHIITECKPSEDKTLYAVFKKEIKIEYVIQDKVNFQTGINETRAVIYNGNKANIELPKLESINNEYEFIGWSNEEKKAKKDYSGLEIVQVDSDKTYYSVTRKKMPVINTYYYNEGETIKSTEKTCYKYNGEDRCTTTLEKEGKEYKGREIKSFSTNANKVEERPTTGNNTYYAVYENPVILEKRSSYNKGQIEIERYEGTTIASETGMNIIPVKVRVGTPSGINGYSARGWRVDGQASSPTYVNESEIELTSDKILNGVYSKRVTISYYSAGGKTTPAAETKEVYYNSNSSEINVKARFTLAGEVEKEGYEFSKWALENDDTKLYNASSVIELETSKKMYARYTNKKYQITYDYRTNGGSAVSKASEQVEYQKEIDLTSNNPTRATATKTGYKFVGWNTNKNAHKGLASLKIPDKNVTLYAIYSKEVKATWHVFDNASGRVEKDTTVCNKYNNESTCSIETGNLIPNTGYDIVGWSKVEGGKEIDAGNNIFTNVSTNTDFYSVTRKSTPLTATFYYGINDSIVNVKGTCYLYNKETTCKVSSPVRPTTYKTVGFEDWSSDANNYKEANYVINKDTSYYAYYKKTLSVEYNSGTYSSNKASNTTIDSYILYYITSQTEKANIPNINLKTPAQVSNYNTLGWREDTTKTTQKYTSNQNINLTKSYKLYAVYSRTLTLSYDSQGGSAVTSQTATQYYNSGSGNTSSAFKLGTSTRTGYTFQKWCQGSTSGTQYNAGSNITISADTKMYGTWKANTYTLSYNANGGSVSPTSKTITYNSTYGTLPTPSRSGYDFMGWFTAASGGSQITSSTKVTVTAAQTIYAHWAAHNWVHQSTTAATCTAGGAYHYKCSRCGATKSDEIGALGHNYNYTFTGSAYKKCSRCGNVIEAFPSVSVSTYPASSEGSQLFVNPNIIHNFGGYSGSVYIYFSRAVYVKSLTVRPNASPAYAAETYNVYLANGSSTSSFGIGITGSVNNEISINQIVTSIHIDMTSSQSWIAIEYSKINYS